MPGRNAIGRMPVARDCVPASGPTIINASGAAFGIGFAVAAALNTSFAAGSAFGFGDASLAPINVTYSGGVSEAVAVVQAAPINVAVNFAQSYRCSFSVAWHDPRNFACYKFTSPPPDGEFNHVLKSTQVRFAAVSESAARTTRSGTARRSGRSSQTRNAGKGCLT